MIGPLSLLHWINDGLMAVFFLFVGLEVKRELVSGDLSTPAARRLPVIAAAAGMAMPALVYLGGDRRCCVAEARLGDPVGDRHRLRDRRARAGRAQGARFAQAVPDDGGDRRRHRRGGDHRAGLYERDELRGAGLRGGGAGRAAGAQPARGAALWPYLLLAALLWVAVLNSGVHATVAGVLAAFFIPLGKDGDGPLDRLEHALSPWVSYAILPVFGFANAGVALGAAPFWAPLPLGVAAGLFVGKQLGIFGAMRGAVALGIAERPEGAGWVQLYGVALLAGIGFTMSLFIGGLAFADPVLVEEVKVGVLAGSALSAVAGFALLRWASP